MSENKHTPEPSLKDRAEAIGLYDARLIDWVIRVEQLTKQRDELLAALEKCRKELSAWMRDHGDDIATQEAVAEARAAIDSAKGEHP